MRKLVLLISIILTSFYLSKYAFAETIILKSGQKVEGKILERTAKYIKIDFYGVPLTYYLEDIISIDGETSGGQVYQKDLLTNPSYKNNIFKEITSAVVRIGVKTTDGKEYSGTGFIVNSSGVIATNYHVVYSAKEISVTLADEKIYNVTAIINYNTNRDFCLLKIDAENLPIAVLGNSDRLRPGEDIHAVAYLPYKKPTFSKGVFSGTEQFNNYNWLSSTIPLVPKGSGGPVINSQGEIIGMITMSIIDRVNLAVPINEIKPFISTIPKLTIEEFTKIIGGVIVYSQEGDLAYYRNDFEQAISNYNKGIEENPKFASLYGKRGIAYYNKGDFNKAISDFSKVIELDPKNFYAYNLRGHAYLDKDNYELSIVDSTKAIELRPKDSNSYNLRCVACLRINNFDQTISDCSKAIELDPYLAAAYHNRGIAYDNKGYTNQAISDFNKAIELDPTLSAAYYDRGLTYHRIGDIDKAIADYSKAIEINPYYVEAYGNRAGAYLGKHEYSKAWDDIHKRESLGGEIPPAFLKILKEESGREK